MAVKSLKNLDSFSRGYIEGRITQVDFDTTLSGDVKTAVTDSTDIVFTNILVKNQNEYNEIKPQIGQIVSGKNIIGIPKITAVILVNNNSETQISLDIPQTLDANDYLIISDTNSGLDEFNIVGSTLSRTKEDLRTSELIPSELLEYSMGADSGGLKVFLDSYYKFMNTEEFLYKEIEEFQDVVINGVATIRIPDPELKDNKFFSQRAARASQIIDSEGNILTVGPNSIEYDLADDDINVFNVDNLPSELSLDDNSGRTLSIVGLPSRLNNKKIIIRTPIQNLVIANPSFKLNTLEDALNINENDEELLNMMQKEIAPAIDQNIKVNKRALYQRLIDFYRIRGSKDSIDLFFKLFFQDEEIQVNYPWDLTLKTSSGNWDSQSLIAATYDKLPNNVVASDAAASDLYGSSISLDNVVKMMAVGAPGESSNEGAVYIYNSQGNGQSYNSEQKLVSTTGASGDNFGSVVSLSDEIVAISAPNDTDHAGGTAANSGTVEIWQRFLTQAPSTYTWRFQSKLKGSTGGLNFGKDISLDKDTLAVCVPGYVNADRSNGAVIIYKGTGASWVESQIIPTPLELNESGANGWADKILMKGNYLLVSWTSKSSNAGSVSIFRKNLSSGLFDIIPEEILRPDTLNSNDLFGTSVDLDVISNPANPICAISAIGSRSVYVFERTVQNDNTIKWELQDRLLPAGSQTNDDYGASLKIHNNNIIVGAPLSDGLDEDNLVTDCGLIYHFEKTDQWVQKATYEETKTANNKFGSFIEISKTPTFNLLVGTPNSSSGGHIVNFLRPSQDGKYLNNEGFLSDKQKIQDSEFYQKFSYVIKAGRNISQWKNTYNKLVHPAGFKYFGEILVIIKAVRESLGDGAGPLGPRTTITEKTKDIFGNEITEERNVIAYSNAAAFRKTLSSMPGIQPGLIRDDFALLIIALASFFSPVSDARPNRSARLSIVKLETGGAIPADGVSIVESGAGYNTAPTVSSSDGSGAAFETEVNRFGEVVDVIVKGGHPLTASTPATPTSFVFDGSADSGRTASTTVTGKSTGGSRSSASGVNGVVTIVVASDKTIESVTATTAGTGYKVGEVITIPGSDLGGGADLLLTVNQVHSGTGYTANSSLTVQSLSQVANSGLETAIGKVTDLTEITLASNPLTAGIFYKILDLGNATFANFNTISTAGYDRESWKVGDVFQAATTGSSLATTAKLQIAEIGLTINLNSTKKYRVPPTFKIGPPDAIDTLGRPLETNVNAEARVTLNTEILLNGTSKLALLNRYIIAFKGDATDANFNSIAKDQQTTWNVGDTFIAYNDGSVLSSTTATVVPYEAEGRLNGFSITNAGLGYINDPEVKMISNSIHEKRVPTFIPIRIVTNGNDIQHVARNGTVTTTNVDRNNNYFKRKIYNENPILGVKKFTGEYRIDQLGSFNIENVDTSTINNFNVNTIIQPKKDRSS